MARPRRDGTPAAAIKRQRLTEFAVANLKPAKRVYLVWDAKQEGLALAVHPTGRRVWKFIYSFQGRARWYTIGSANKVGIAAARMMARKLGGEVAHNRDPQAEKMAAARGGDTFTRLAKLYVDDYAKKNNKSWAQADALVQKYLLPRWGRMSAADVRRQHVKTLMRTIAAPVLANQVLAAASAIFSWGIREDLVAANPCLRVDRNKTASRARVLSDTEIPIFWQEFDAAGLVASTALKVLLLTGQRPGEVRAMRREHIVDGFWEMPGKPVPSLKWPGTKNARDHKVWLPQAAQDLIADLGDGGLVFAGERGGAIDDLDVAMRMACATLKAERATPHDLRRTHGTMITRLGFGRDAMNRIQNHVEGGIASVYDRYAYESENKKVMEAVANKIMSLVTGAGGANVVDFR